MGHVRKIFTKAEIDDIPNFPGLSSFFRCFIKANLGFFSSSGLCRLQCFQIDNQREGSKKNDRKNLNFGYQLAGKFKR